MVIAVLFFTLIDASAKSLSIVGIPILQIVYCRYAGHFLYTFALYLPKFGYSAFKSNLPFKQFLRSVFLFSSTILNFFALKSLPITLTTTIFFAGPILVTLFAIPILGEKVGIRRIIAVCFGFFGVLIVVQPWGVSFHPAIFFSLGALFTASMYFIMTRMVANSESNAVMQLWSSGIPTILLLPFAVYVWIWPQTWGQILIMFAIGAFGAFGHLAAAIAHRWADASILAPMIYTQIFFAAILSYFIFDTLPTLSTFAGGVIIIGSGIYIWQRERIRNPQIKQRLT